MALFGSIKSHKFSIEGFDKGRLHPGQVVSLFKAKQKTFAQTHRYFLKIDFNCFWLWGEATFKYQKYKRRPITDRLIFIFALKAAIKLSHVSIASGAWMRSTRTDVTLLPPLVTMTPSWSTSAPGIRTTSTLRTGTYSAHLWGAPHSHKKLFFLLYKCWWTTVQSIIGHFE